jgi:plastocyanin
MDREPIPIIKSLSTVRKTSTSTIFSLNWIFLLSQSHMIAIMLSFFRLAVVLAATFLPLSVVHAVDLFAPDWVIPQNGMPYPSLTASVGDTLTFGWTNGVHDVHIHPTHTCDPDGSIQIASTSDNPTTYTFVAADGSPEGTVHTFVCQVGEHCEQGMYMNVTGE